jgi:hypothetical protein
METNVNAKMPERSNNVRVYMRREGMVEEAGWWKEDVRSQGDIMVVVSSLYS